MGTVACVNLSNLADLVTCSWVTTLICLLLCLSPRVVYNVTN